MANLIKRILALSVAIIFGSFTNFFAQDSTHIKVSRMIDSVSMQNLQSHIRILENAWGYQSRVNLTPGSDSAAQWIKRELEKFPSLQVELDTFFISSAQAPFNTKPVFNVVATIRGIVDDYVILGAHYDASASRMGTTVWQNQWATIKAPGADDNATGVAALLEIARAFSDPQNNFRPYYTIKLIAFGAEEAGVIYTGNHHGSVNIARKAKLRGDRIVGMISLDMIGYNPLHLYTAIVANTQSEWIGRVFRNMNVNFNLGLLTNAPPFPYANYSDHHSFVLEGYSAILIIENAPPWNNGPYYTANPYYHTSADSSGTLNMNLVRKVTQLSLASVAFMSAVTDINEEDENFVLKDFFLYQNYPNPFNPSTVINYNVPVASRVNITVYDLLGRQVAILVDEVKQAGKYETKFNAIDNEFQSLSSGLYFYRLNAQQLDAGKSSNFTVTKKMMLMR